MPAVKVTLITGYLGAGKTTLLRNIIAAADSVKLAVVMNEFGRIAIDGKVIEGKNVRITELTGGCVCCSLSGEFSAAIDELIALAKPDRIIVETTGAAEPSALAYDLARNMPGVRLDAVITIVDADALLKSPSIGHTGMEQIALADLILLNKKDLVSAEGLDSVKAGLKSMNPHAVVACTERCDVPIAAIFNIGPCDTARYADDDGDAGRQDAHTHEPEYEHFDFTCDRTLDHGRFMAFMDALPDDIYRSKGFTRTERGTFLVNRVAGRQDMEPFPCERTELVFIGIKARKHEKQVRERLESI
jgi:G3E family GTPase